jgi:DNA-binding NtrC family response regulator/ligand-binding sensor domain-containing protein
MCQARYGDMLYCFGVYQTPAGPGKTVRAGTGVCQGVWQSFDVLDGLPMPIINALAQDQHGNLWIGNNMGGISRYDGAHFTTFTEDDGLVYNGVQSLLEDRRGHLWIGTHHHGVSRYDGECFETFTTADGLAHNFVTCMLEDRHGRIWFGTADGVSCYDGTHFTNFTPDDGLVNSSIVSILEDRDGDLWFATPDGIIHYDGIRFIDLTQKDGLVFNEARCSMCQDRNGTLWFGTTKGVSRYDGNDFTIFTEDNGLSDNTVRTIFEDQAGHLWFGTTKGVSRYDGKDFTTFTEADGLAFDDVDCILEDRDGDLWFGTAGGISRYSGNQFRTFTTEDGLVENEVLSIFEDKDGALWFGTEGGQQRGGVSRFDGEGFVNFTEKEGLAFGRVSDIAQDGDGNFWFGTIGGDGVSCYDGAGFTNYAEKEGLSEGTVWAVDVDRQGYVWCGTNGGGVSRFDGKDFVTFTREDGLAGDTVLHILEDCNGHLWFGTDSEGDGVSCYDGNRFTTFTADDGLLDGSIEFMLEDRDGALWFGNWNGLSRYDGKRFTTFTPADRLEHPAFLPTDGPPRNGTGPILQDTRGHLWFAISGGLCRFDGSVFQTLMRRDGLANNRVHDLFQTRDGDIWAATAGGVTRYRPSYQPLGLALEDVMTDRHHGPVAHIETTVAQPLLAFEFRGRSFKTRPDQLVYLYRLQGHHEQWRQTRANRIEYQDLPLGDYCFEVRAVDRDLNYSETAVVQITVTPDPSVEAWQAALSTGGFSGEFIGQSKALQRVWTRLKEVASTDLTVLILGETGTGKGLAARAVHTLSAQNKGLFMPVNYGALPDNLVESELFGHERGAFTGATARKLGKVELAQGGTLFLDEIGDLAPVSQVKLLHLIEDRTFERLGGTQRQQAEVRILAATNRNLEQMVRQGDFREDLYFRLQPFPVHMPPLRDRREDIPLLTAHFVQQMADHLDKPVTDLTPAALRVLTTYGWPGNVRELEHVVKRAVVLCDGTTIQAADIALGPREAEDTDVELVPLSEHERRYILKVLEQTGWIIKGDTGAAQILGLPVSTLRSRMKKLGIARSQVPPK